MTEIVNRDAHEGLEVQVHPPEEPTTAEAKILRTLRDMSQPDPDSGELELMLATVAMGLEKALAEQLAQFQASGDLDEWVLALVRFLADHRSESARRLVVVELPRGRELPTGTRLHLLDEAMAAAEQAESPF